MATPNDFHKVVNEPHQLIPHHNILPLWADLLFFTYFSNFSMLSLLPRYHAVSECEWYWSHLSTANWNRISHTLALNILIIFCHGEDMKRPLQGNKIHTCYWTIMMMNKSWEHFSPYLRTKQIFYLSCAKILFW